MEYKQGRKEKKVEVGMEGVRLRSSELNSMTNKKIYLETNESGEDVEIEIPEGVTMVNLSDIFGMCVRVLPESGAIMFEDDSVNEEEDPVVRSTLISFDPNGGIVLNNGPNDEGVPHSVLDERK